MEHLITEYIWTELESKEWLTNAQHEGYSWESQMITLYQELANDVDSEGRIGAVIIDFAKAFDVLLKQLDGSDVKKMGAGILKK